jgi:hypothetical protein
MAKPRKKKATKDCTRSRIDELLRIKLDGAEFWDCREYVREKEQEPESVWKLAEDETPLSDSQIRRYLQKVQHGSESYTHPALDAAFDRPQVPIPEYPRNAVTCGTA